MSADKNINRWHDAITPRDKVPLPWTIKSGGSWDMLEVQPISDEMLSELARRYYSAGAPWNCRSIPLSDSDREYMFMLYYAFQGMVARLRVAEAELARRDAVVSYLPCFTGAELQGRFDMAEVKFVRLADVPRPAALAPEAPQPKLTLALPDYEQRQIIIVSDEVIDGERLVCVAIVEEIPEAPHDRQAMTHAEMLAVVDPWPYTKAAPEAPTAAQAPEVDIIERAAKICEGFCAADDSETEDAINGILRQRAQRIRGLAAPATEQVKAEPILPPMPKALYRHPKLGDMFDRMQMHFYATKHAEGMARLYDAAVAQASPAKPDLAGLTEDKIIELALENFNGAYINLRNYNLVGFESLGLFKFVRAIRAAPSKE